MLVCARLRHVAGKNTLLPLLKEEIGEQAETVAAMLQPLTNSLNKQEVEVVALGAKLQQSNAKALWETVRRAIQIKNPTLAVLGMKCESGYCGNRERHKHHVLLTRLPLDGNPDSVSCKHSTYTGPSRSTCMS